MRVRPLPEWTLVLALGAASFANAGQPRPLDTEQTPARPTFHATSERIVIDVTVVSDKGEVVPGLAAGDFVLTIDGKPRQVASAEWIRADTRSRATVEASDTTGSTFSSNETAAGGRLVLVAFDLDGIPAGSGRNATQATAEFLDALSSADQVSLVAFPNGASVPFSTDRTRLRQELDQIVGRGSNEFPHAHAVGISEAFDIDSGNTFALDRVVARECSPARGADPSCPSLVAEEARNLATTYRLRFQSALQALQALLVSLQKIDGPKTVIWVSGGVPFPFSESGMGTLSADAAAAHATVYVVHLDNAAAGVDASRAQRSPTSLEDRAVGLHGLEMMAGATRGAVFSTIGTGGDAFARIAREMSAYYLLGIEAQPTDRDGKTHRINVSVGRHGLTVRARREFVVPSAAEAGASSRSPEEEVVRVLQAPQSATELPVSIATYNLRAPGGDKVRVLVASDIGRLESGALDTILGYLVRSSQGKTVASAVHTTRAEPMDGAGPGPVHATVAVDLPPGKYSLKLAVVDTQGRKGSVEHAFDASLSGAGGIEVADLVLAPPISESAPSMRLTAAPSARAAPLDAYLEFYGAAASSPPRIAVEVLDANGGPALASTDAPVSQRREKGRFAAETQLPLGLLPPGIYVARATVTIGSRTATRTRQFRILEPVPSEALFEADLEARVGAFDPASVLTPSLLGPALASAESLDEGRSAAPARALSADLAAGRLSGLGRRKAIEGDPSLLASFLRGLSLYRDGRIEEAAGQFRAAIRQSPDFLPGVFYLGACYAAGGKARESVGAWQTALVSDRPLPDVYHLVADAYLRLGETDQAALLLEEAVARWPEDAGFRLEGALARAANGHVDEALDGLQPALASRAPSPEILALAVRLSVARLTVRRDEAAEAGLRALVARLAAEGSEVPVVAARWIAYLDRRAKAR
jgi:VWFA-related protein